MDSEWLDNAEAIILEGVRAYFAGFERGALHAAYDAVSTVCIGLGLAKYPGTGSFHYVQSVEATCRKLGVPAHIESSLEMVGASRNALAHDLTWDRRHATRWPSMKPFTPLPLNLSSVLYDVILLMEAAGVQVTGDVVKYRGRLWRGIPPKSVTRRRETAYSSPPAWDRHAVALLREAVTLYRKSLYRSALHSLHDCVSVVCELGFDRDTMPKKTWAGKVRRLCRGRGVRKEIRDCLLHLDWMHRVLTHEAASIPYTVDPSTLPVFIGGVAFFLNSLGVTVRPSVVESLLGADVGSTRMRGPEFDHDWFVTFSTSLLEQVQYGDWNLYLTIPKKWKFDPASQCFLGRQADLRLQCEQVQGTATTSSAVSVGRYLVGSRDPAPTIVSRGKVEVAGAKSSVVRYVYRDGLRLMRGELVVLAPSPGSSGYIVDFHGDAVMFHLYRALLSRIRQSIAFRPPHDLPTPEK